MRTTKPVYHDGCYHNRSCDEFLGTIEAQGSSGQKRYDVYVYQDNELRAHYYEMRME